MRSFFRQTGDVSSMPNFFPAGMEEIHNPDFATVDIVLIHGLSGDREKTWTAAGQARPWPETLLPFEISTARILTFGYDASVADFLSVVSTNRIGNHAWNLLTQLASHREDESTNGRPIVFICHSLGGLVCEDALVKSKERREPHIQDILHQTRGIIFMGTPHHGAGLAKWAELIFRYVNKVKQTNTDIIRVLKRDSEVLARVQDSFHTLLLSRKHDGLDPIDITCFYEELPVQGIGLIVAQDSAILPGYIPIGIRGNHLEMTKFANAEDPGFKAVCTEIRRWMKQPSWSVPSLTTELVTTRVSVTNLMPQTSNPAFVRRGEIHSHLEDLSGQELGDNITSQSSAARTAKRSLLINAPQSAKRSASPATQEEEPSFNGGQSVRQQAEAYELARVKLPLDAMTCQWEDGMNRAFVASHAAWLCSIFESTAVEREAEENYLLVQCSTHGVQRMLSILSNDEKSRLATDKKTVVSFLQWLLVNPGISVEVLAGQHRIAALKEYARRRKVCSENLWWTCIIYMKEALPPLLRIQLTLNRQDATLRDNNGQIWCQLISLPYVKGGGLNNDPKWLGEKKILHMLQLGTENKAVVSRLITLWRNLRWREIITRWCNTPFGRASFEAYTWGRLASLQLDNYWFTICESGLHALHHLPSDAAHELTKKDWKILTTKNKIDVTLETVIDLFYPGAETVHSEKRELLQFRRRDFLRGLSDDIYHETFLCLRDPAFIFPEIERLFKTNSKEGQVLKKVMRHVVAWVNPSPSQTINHQKPTKPLIREDLKVALLHGALANERKTEFESIEIERLVIDYLWREMEFFTTPAANLDVFPNDDPKGYYKRFLSHTQNCSKQAIRSPWGEILHLVKSVFGDRFHPLWGIELINIKQTSMEQREDTIAQRISRSAFDLISNLPEVANMQAIGGEGAADALAATLDMAISNWVAQCEAESQKRAGGISEEEINS